MRDDLPAVQRGVFCLLPHRDSSGRNLLIREQSLRIPEQHTTESLVRVYWYLLELVAQENPRKVSEFVVLTWEKHSSLWDYDRALDDWLACLDRDNMPVRMSACHVCCPPWPMLLVIRPVEFAIFDKRVRQRIMIHSVRESQLPEVLATFGISKDILPTKMGGAVALDQSEWIKRQISRESEGR